MAEPKGKYVKKGDVEEWEWDHDGPGVPKLTGGWVVPDGDFDPTSAPPLEPSPSEKAAGAVSPARGLHVAEQKTIEEKPKAKAADKK